MLKDSHDLLVSCEHGPKKRGTFAAEIKNQRYRSEGKLPYQMYGKSCRYRLSDVEKFSGIHFRAIGVTVADEVAAANTQRISNIINHK